MLEPVSEALHHLLRKQKDLPAGREEEGPAGLSLLPGRCTGVMTYVY